jgi:hypothetical protein
MALQDSLQDVLEVPFELTGIKSDSFFRQKQGLVGVWPVLASPSALLAV